MASKIYCFGAVTGARTTHSLFAMSVWLQDLQVNGWNFTAPQCNHERRVVGDVQAAVHRGVNDFIIQHQKVSYPLYYYSFSWSYFQSDFWVTLLLVLEWRLIIAYHSTAHGIIVVLACAAHRYSTYGSEVVVFVECHKVVRGLDQSDRASICSRRLVRVRSLQLLVEGLRSHSQISVGEGRQASQQLSASLKPCIPVRQTQQLFLNLSVKHKVINYSLC